MFLKSLRFERARRSSFVVTLASSIVSIALTSEVHAREGTHPVVASTWDARASSVSLAYRRGFLDGGGMSSVSYHANFSSTTGKLSSQFGLHYVNLDDGSEAPTAHGLSATATALFNFPVASRFENGLARAAIAFYVGSAPTALVSGERNFLSIPLVFGLGVPLTPARAITLTPWFELSPGVNLDTVIHPIELAVDPAQFVDPQTGQLTLTQDDVEGVLTDAVELETSVAVGARAGLDLALHLSDAVDLGASATLSSLGPAFAGTRVIYLGGSFVWRWDDIVPAVLPAEKRLLNESCDAVEARFRSCPNARRWRTPEELVSPAVPAASGDFAPRSAPPSATPIAPPAPVPPPAPASPPVPPPAEPAPISPPDAVPAPAPLLPGPSESPVPIPLAP